MKKTIEQSIKIKFLELLKTNDIESIDVKMICDSIGIKRQSFYYHYKNIYDVICAIFSEVELPSIEADDYDSIIIGLLDFLYTNEEFNKEVLNSSAKDIVQEYSFSFLYRSFNKYLEKFSLRVDSLKDISRLISKAVGEQILFYFGHGDYTKDEIFQKISYLMNSDLLNLIVKNYKNIKN